MSSSDWVALFSATDTIFFCGKAWHSQNNAPQLPTAFIMVSSQLTLKLHTTEDLSVPCSPCLAAVLPPGRGWAAK